MSGLYLLIPTLIVIAVSFLIVRAAAIALTLTGMEEQRARFQALSAFSGTGFTTKDAEIVVNNPRRRQIVMWLMILGNAGIVAVIVSATSSIVSSHDIGVPIAIVLS
jgi:Trk-type K+ transport system membrane component